MNGVQSIAFCDLLNLRVDENKTEIMEDKKEYYFLKYRFESRLLVAHNLLNRLL